MAKGVDKESFSAALDDLLKGRPVAPSEEEQARLRLVLDNQKRSARVLKALSELLVEKGLLSAEQLKAKID
jgi:hypothetical protein